jgi:hypothetical protein
VEERVISKRGLVVAAALGTGSALLAAGSAFACNIQDFKVDSSVACDNTGASPMAKFTVTDNDGSHTAAVIDIYTRNADGSNGAKVTSLSFPDATVGQTLTQSVAWVDNATYNVVVEPNKYIKSPQTSEVHPTTSGISCTVAQPTQAPTPTSTPTPTTAPVSATTAPATPAPASSSPGTVLAETGGGSNSGMIAGFAAALVVVGGGVLYTVRRRAAAARH